jgi:hypothetical protein
MKTQAKPARLAAATHVMNWTCDRSSDRPGLLILWTPWRLIVGASPTTSPNLDQ